MSADSPPRVLCLHGALTEEEFDDIREAAEAVFERATEPQSTEEWVAAVLAEADARLQRRNMRLVRSCPHCGGDL